MNFVKKYIAELSLAFLVPLALLILVLSFRPALQRIFSDFMSPFLFPLIMVDNGISTSSFATLSKRQLAANLDAANAELMRLRLENSELKRLLSENGELRRMLSLPPRDGFRCKFAKISVRDPLFWLEAFTIDIGEDEGVHAGDIVLSTSVKSISPHPYAVVGRIHSTSKNSSEVRTILDRNCRFGLFISEEFAPAILGGGIPDPSDELFRVDYLPRNVQFKPGIEIVTSPLSPTIPPFLPVGRVAATLKTPPPGMPDSYQFLSAMPYADFRTLRFAIVMTKK